MSTAFWDETFASSGTNVRDVRGALATIATALPCATLKSR